ncbi:MAG: hypothetical protein IJT43_00235 [Stomatobaculum sp.]|nr:hypothetical protein [Stomatobaculum sp.]
MSNNTIILLCFLAVAIAIVLSFTRGVNLGITAMTGAFLIGVLCLNKSVANIYGYWPDNWVFFLIAGAVFYGFARENGTLTLLGSKMLYAFRDRVVMVPAIFALIAMIMGYLGAGPGTIVLLSPIGYAICQQIGMDPLLMVFAIDCGYNCGTMNPFTGTGVVLYGLVQETAGEELGFATYFHTYGLFVLSKIVQVAMIYAYFHFKKKDGSELGKGVQIEALQKKPEPFNDIQKKTLVLIFTCFFLMVVPNILNTLVKFPKGSFAKTFVNLCKPHAILIIFSMIASIMKLANPKKVLQRIPMNTVMIVSGVAFLMEIAKEAGLNDLVVAFFEGSTFPKFLLPPVFVLIAAFLSVFSSGTGVVLPLMFPMVPALCAATGLNPVTLYASAQIGALATPISPFSTAGSQFIGLAPEEYNDYLIRGQLILGIVMALIGAAMALVGFCSIWPI